MTAARALMPAQNATVSGSNQKIAVVGGGPAGLIAAEILAAGGAAVTVYDRMPSPGRKFLLAGRGGLNLTHTELLDRFLSRYGAARARLAPAIKAFPPAALVAWAEGLGQKTFVGSSGRIFPMAQKSSPLLRAWLRRLAELGVALAPRHRWTGWRGDALTFDTPTGPIEILPDATVLALGGVSWPRLGSDGGWAACFPHGSLRPFQPANCGFTVAWSEHFRARFPGAPLKRIALSFGNETVRGEAVVTEAGIEGGAIYALSAPLRDAILSVGTATVLLDLRPDFDAAEIARRLGAPRRGQSLSTFLRKTLALPPVAIGLLQEALHRGGSESALAALTKAVPLALTAPAPIARAISTAGGLALDELDDSFMLKRRPGVFAAGEMLDWEAPTGGFLLQACFATGVAAGHGALAWARGRATPSTE
jgi:uncharacterized flavoprotein (TIGR03862 family)